MRLHLAALAALVVTSGAAPPALATDQLTLDDAFERVASTHPETRLFGPRAEGRAAEFNRASQRPALLAGASLENALGTGETSGLEAAELTLTLASVFERGGKLDARRTLAQTNLDALAVEREVRRLDLLAEVARRYLAMVAARQQREIAQLDIEQRRRTESAAMQRLKAGASPESVLLTAQAALARAELDHARAEQRQVAARRHLAALWGERDPVFDIVAGNPLALPEIGTFAELGNLLERTPELAQFADERRIREARLQLARSERSADLGWQVGVRRLEVDDDFALLGSIFLPLGAARRAEPGIRVAEAELAALEIEREAKGVSLYSTLAEAHGRYQTAQLEVQRLQDEVLPALGKAAAAAEHAYRGGAISYLEWAQLQSERTSTRRQQLEAALDAQRALIEIQRLTGLAFVATPTTQGSKP